MNDVQELDPASAVDFLRSAKPQQTQELSPEDATAFLKGIAPPEPPSTLGVMAGRLMSIGANTAQAIGQQFDELASTEPASRGGMRPLDGGTSGSGLSQGFAQPAGAYARGPQIGQNFSDTVGGALRQGAEAVYPQASHGRGSFLSEDLPAAVTGIIPAAALTATGNPALGAAAFGLDAGGQAYDETLKKTGDHEKAMKALIGNELMAGGLSVVSPGGRLGAAIKKLALADKLTGGAGGKATLIGAIGKSFLGGEIAAVAQSAYHDALAEHLTGEDVDILKNAVGAATDPANVTLNSLTSLVHGIAESKARLNVAAEGERAATEEAANTSEIPKSSQPQVESELPAGVQAQQSATGSGSLSGGDAVQLGVPAGSDKGASGGYAITDEQALEHAKRTRSAVYRNPGFQTGEKAGIAKGFTSDEYRALSREMDSRALDAVEAKDVPALKEHAAAIIAKGEPPITPEEIQSARGQLELRARVAGEKVTPQTRMSDLVRSLRELVNEHKASLEESPSDSADSMPDVIQRAERVLANRRDAGVAETEMDATLGDLLHATKLPPETEFGSRKEKAQTDYLLAATKKAQAMLDVFDAAKKASAGERPPTTSKLPEATNLVVEPQAAPKPDETQQLVYGGLPPLYETKNITGAKVKETLTDGLRKRGASPEQAALAVERASGEVNAQATQAKIASRRLQRAMTKEWGRKAAEGQEAQQRIQDALTDPEKMMALPEGIRAAALELRAHADANARTIVSEGMVDTPMAKTFEKNMGRHLRRQYQAHSDPAWAQKIEPDVRNRLKSLLVSWSEELTPAKEQELKGKIADKKAPTMARREAEFELGSRQALQGKSEDQIVAQMEHMLADAKAVADNPWAAIGSSKVKRKDLSLFKARKGMPEEMRAFLGEVKDPRVNYVTTIMKQAQLIAAHRKFREMRADGMGKWLFEEPTVKNGTKYVAEVSSGKNPALEPLTKGKPLYTTEEIKKALFDVQPAAQSKAMRWAIAANALIKTSKIIWSPITIAKQVHQNFTTALRSGHVEAWPKYGKEALRALTGRDEAGLLKLTRLGLVGESVAAAEYRDLGTTLKGKQLAKPYRGVAHANDLMGAAFGFPDTFAKVVAWHAETERLTKAGFSQKQAEAHAADIVRNLYPTYSRITPFVDRWRKQPVFGTFMAWNAEKIRTTHELYKLIRSELDSQNPEVRANGIKRIGWAMIGTAAAPAAALSVNMLNGIDKQEDDERRKHVAPWDKEKNLLWLGGKNEGQYLDLSDIDSNAWTTDSISRLMHGDDIGSILEDAFRENLSPFVEPSMLTQTIAGLALGEEIKVIPGNGKVIETRDRDRAELLWKALKPGAAQAIDFKDGRFTVRKDAASQLVGLSGLRPQRFDVRESVKYASYEFLDALQEAKSDEKARRQAFAALSDKARSALTLGVPYREVRNILDEKLGQESIDAILAGSYLPYRARSKPQ